MKLDIVVYYDTSTVGSEIKFESYKFCNLIIVLNYTIVYAIRVQLRCVGGIRFKFALGIIYFIKKGKSLVRILYLKPKGYLYK